MYCDLVPTLLSTAQFALCIAIILQYSIKALYSALCFSDTQPISANKTSCQSIRGYDGTWLGPGELG